MSNTTTRLTYSPAELANVLGIGRNAAYTLCRQQGFPAIRIGNRYFIPVQALTDWLNEQAQKREDND